MSPQSHGWWRKCKKKSVMNADIELVSSLLIQDKEGRTVDLSDGIKVTPVQNDDMHMDGAGLSLMGHGFGKH